MVAGAAKLPKRQRNRSRTGQARLVGAHLAIAASAKACMSSTTISGTGTFGVGRTALPGRLISAARDPAAWAPIVSHRWQATMQRSDALTPRPLTTMS